MADGEIVRRTKAKVISNIKVGPDYYRMALDVGSTAGKIEPGQFFNILCADGKSMEPLLRRPFSIHRIRGQGIVEILYEVIGKATSILSRKEKGDMLDIIGPLGNGFPVEPDGKSAILVAGGIGVAPLLALAEQIAYSVKRTAHSVFIGAKSRKEILCEKDFRKLGFEVFISTEDGSKGYKGLITDLLYKKLFAKRYSLDAVLYACGPNAMLKEISKLAGKRNIRAFGSLEEHMSCGVGSCYGCVIKTKQGYKRVCKDGPVFELKEIIW